MRKQPAGPWTYEDLLALPDEGKGFELIDGELVQKASPRASHSWSQGRVARSLGGLGEPPLGSWWILIEPDWRITRRRVVRPDLAGWQRDRLPDLPDGVLETAPDWICEILSPGHLAHDREVKRRIYAEAKVPWYWLLDPDDRLLEVFELRGGGWALTGTWTEGRVALPPFDLEIDVGSLFVPRPPMVHEGPLL